MGPLGPLLLPEVAPTSPAGVPAQAGPPLRVGVVNAPGEVLGPGGPSIPGSPSDPGGPGGLPPYGPYSFAPPPRRSGASMVTIAVVGVLCLCFNFEQEMAGIFHSHRDPAGRSNMLLLDRDKAFALDQPAPSESLARLREALALAPFAR